MLGVLVFFNQFCSYMNNEIHPQGNPEKYKAENHLLDNHWHLSTHIFLGRNFALL